MFCSIYDFTFLMTDTKIKGQVSFESSEKKKLLPARVKFVSKIYYVACTINHAGNLICLHACLQDCNCAHLIDNPEMLQGCLCQQFLSSHS